MSEPIVNMGQELTNVPFGTMISSMALAIADAQWRLDKASMTVAELMSGSRQQRDLDTGKQLLDPTTKLPLDPIDSRVNFGYTYELSANGKDFVRVPQKVSMMELGFVPTFYQFVETLLEVKISISVSKSVEDSSSVGSSSSNTGSAASSSGGGYGYGYGYGYGWGYGYSGSYGSSYSNTNVSAAHVNARHANMYDYKAEGASIFRTKMTPIPPPAVLEERIRAVVATERAFNEYVLANADAKEANDAQKAEFAKENFLRRINAVDR